VYTSCSLLEVHGGNGRLALDVRCRRLPSEHVGIMNVVTGVNVGTKLLTMLNHRLHD